MLRTGGGGCTTRRASLRVGRFHTTQSSLAPVLPFSLSPSLASLRADFLSTRVVPLGINRNPELVDDQLARLLVEPLDTLLACDIPPSSDSDRAFIRLETWSSNLLCAPVSFAL